MFQLKLSIKEIEIYGCFEKAGVVQRGNISKKCIYEMIVTSTNYFFILKGFGYEVWVNINSGTIKFQTIIILPLSFVFVYLS